MTSSGFPTAKTIRELQTRVTEELGHVIVKWLDTSQSRHAPCASATCENCHQLISLILDPPPRCAQIRFVAQNLRAEWDITPCDNAKKEETESV